MASSSGALPFRAGGAGIRIAVRLSPGGAADRIQGLQQAPDGTTLLKVSVTAAAESGRANRALLELLAKAWHVPKSSLSLVAGARDRRKLVELVGEPARLLPLLRAWHDRRG